MYIKLSIFEKMIYRRLLNFSIHEQIQCVFFECATEKTIHHKIHKRISSPCGFSVGFQIFFEKMFNHIIHNLKSFLHALIQYAKMIYHRFHNKISSLHELIQCGISDCSDAKLIYQIFFLNE